MFWRGNQQRFLEIILFFGMVSFLCVQQSSAALSWTELKGDHFLIYYSSAEDLNISQQVLREAESDYRNIAEQIGYARYQDFWTWENRVKIYLYPDEETFSKETQQPSWSRGFSFRDAHVRATRIIVTFKQEGDFIDGVLPHEITHLILRDFMGQQPLPLWFNEGMAQLQERTKAESAQRIMRKLVKMQKQLPMAELLAKENVVREDSPINVAIFYAESISILDFLIKKYGSGDFATMCKELRDGKNFGQALKSTYSDTFDSVSVFEQKWLNYLRE